MRLPEALRAALADRYELLRELGQGGMATVYLARDVRHAREVAIKVLHPELAAVLGAERFLSEIRTTASLQHPHILPLFDSGEAAGQLFYVMPFVDGETLRSRLEREKQLPIADAVLLAREVADALQYAHDRGIIHRDIKPENILLQGGHALVADFGIALAVTNAGGARMTQTGLSLGTPQYMAPEQAMGERTIDARADVYALGAVTYEMLAGEPPFTGPTSQAIVARVLTERPRPLTSQRETVPEPVDVAVLTAMAKLPADRFPSARAFAEQLRAEAGTSRTTAPTPHGRAAGVRSTASRWRAALPFLLGGVALGVSVGAFAASRATRSSATSPAALPLMRVTLDNAIMPNGVMVSPDGNRLVVHEQNSVSGFLLSERQAADTAFRRVSAIPWATSTGTTFFSPDGRELVGLECCARLVLVTRTGTRKVLVDSVVGLASGGTWSERGQIVLSLNGVLMRLPASGGAPTPWVSPRDSTERLLRPHFLPGGRELVAIRGRRREFEVVLVNEAGEVRPLGMSGSNVSWVDAGYLVVGDGNIIRAYPFDRTTSRVAGDPITLATDAAAPLVAGSYLTAARNGTVWYLPSDASPNEATLFDRTGLGRTLPLPLGQYYGPTLSPDGRWLAVGIGDLSVRTDIWTVNLASMTLFRLTRDSLNTAPVWLPGGREVAYSANPGGAGIRTFVAAPADGSRDPNTVLGMRDLILYDLSVSADGALAAVSAIGRSDTNRDLYLVPLAHPEQARRIAGPTTTETQPRLSADGQWLLYVSDRSGNPEVYVRSTGSDSTVVRLSTAGGRFPRWTRNDREVVYAIGDSLMSVAVSTGGAFTHGAPQLLFRTQLPIRGLGASDDGERFVVVREPTARRRINGILNWIPR
ncbi:MAG: serine/threonine-protein kinase [Gemmatimonadaceae bacterium]|nr:serine/threonine-protein kinase [Gemmatimonadaceae bacterium]